MCQSDKGTKDSLCDVRVETVISDHCQGFLGESALILYHVIQVLLSEPRRQIVIYRLIISDPLRHDPMISSRYRAHSEPRRYHI